MNYIVNKVAQGEDELILNYTELNTEVEAAINFMNINRKKLSGRCNGEVVCFSPNEVLYVEKVDDKTFVYTKDREIQIDMSLYSLELLFDNRGFFRCSKSMIVNVDKVMKLKSMPSNRIDVTLENEEHIIISRTYASDFRRLIRGEM